LVRDGFGGFKGIWKAIVNLPGVGRLLHLWWVRKGFGRP
jgi:hypothetical protein